MNATGRGLGSKNLGPFRAGLELSATGYADLDMDARHWIFYKRIDKGSKCDRMVSDVRHLTTVKILHQNRTCVKPQIQVWKREGSLP